MSRVHKYGAVATVVDNIRFASKKEARRYVELRLLERAGEITHLCLQPRFALYAAGPMDGGTVPVRPVGVYIGDFQYRDQRSQPVRGVTVVEDVKGYDLPLAKWKRKHMAIQYGIQVQIVRYGR